MTENIDWTFIDAHSADNVRELALKKEMQRRPDAAFLLQQISGRQTAKGKIPTWAGCKQIIYPKHLSLEQCSSEPTASYKADFAARLFSHSDSVI